MKNQGLIEYGERAGAYSEFDKLFTTAKTDYNAILKISRVALKPTKDLLTVIGADQQKKNTISGCFDQMQTFYDNTVNNKEIINILSEYGYTYERINELRDQYLAARASYSLFYKEETEAITATKNRDAIIEELDNFYSDLLTVAKVAFVGREELLNQIC